MQETIEALAAEVAALKHHAQRAPEAKARVRELFTANPALLHEAVRNNTISGALNVTWADLAALTSTNDQTIEKTEGGGK